jgi:hypothetical protein
VWWWGPGGGRADHAPGAGEAARPGGVSLIIPNPLGVEHLEPVLGALLIGTFPGMMAAVGAFLAAALVLPAVPAVTVIGRHRTATFT